MKIISTFLHDDHRRLDDQFKKFKHEAMAGQPAAKQIVARFAQGLKRHMVWEETLVFPVFEERSGMAGSGPIPVMRGEHQQFRALLEQIESRLQKSEAVEEPARELTHVLALHNQKEETVLYPWIDELLTETEAQGLVERMRTMPQETPPP